MFKLVGNNWSMWISFLNYKVFEIEIQIRDFLWKSNIWIKMFSKYQIPDFKDLLQKKLM